MLMINSQKFMNSIHHTEEIMKHDLKYRGLLIP